MALEPPPNPLDSPPPPPPADPVSTAQSAAEAVGDAVSETADDVVESVTGQTTDPADTAQTIASDGQRLGSDLAGGVSAPSVSIGVDVEVGANRAGGSASADESGATAEADARLGGYSASGEIEGDTTGLSAEGTAAADTLFGDAQISRSDALGVDDGGVHRHGSVDLAVDTAAGGVELHDEFSNDGERITRTVGGSAEVGDLRFSGEATASRDAIDSTDVGEATTEVVSDVTDTSQRLHDTATDIVGSTSGVGAVAGGIPIPDPPPPSEVVDTIQDGAEQAAQTAEDTASSVADRLGDHVNVESTRFDAGDGENYTAGQHDRLGVEVGGVEVGIDHDAVAATDPDTSAEGSIGVYVSSEGDEHEVGITVGSRTDDNSARVEAGAYTETGEQRREAGVTAASGVSDQTFAFDIGAGVYADADGDKGEIGVHTDTDGFSAGRGTIPIGGTYVDDGETRTEIDHEVLPLGIVNPTTTVSSTEASGNPDHANADDVVIAGIDDEPALTDDDDLDDLDRQLPPEDGSGSGNGSGHGAAHVGNGDASPSDDSSADDSDDAAGANALIDQSGDEPFAVGLVDDVGDQLAGAVDTLGDTLDDIFDGLID